MSLRTILGCLTIVVTLSAAACGDDDPVAGTGGTAPGGTGGGVAGTDPVGGSGGGVAGAGGAVPATDPFQHHFGVCWRGSVETNIRVAGALGYQTIIEGPGSNWLNYADRPEAQGMRFFIESPENGFAPTLPTIDDTTLADLQAQSFGALFASYPQVSGTFQDQWFDDLHAYDAAIWDQYRTVLEQHFCWSDPNAAFPRNMAQAWIFGDGSYRMMWDYQQQAIIDLLVETIGAAARARENLANDYRFTGVAWDVASRWMEFSDRTILYDAQTYPRAGSDPDATAAPHAGVVHDHASFREGVLQFYLQLRAALEEEFAGEQQIFYIFEPWAIWGGGWTADWPSYLNIVHEAPFLTPQEKQAVVGDYLTAEGPGLTFFTAQDPDGELDEIEGTGLVTSQQIGSSTQSLYDHYYDPVEDDHLTHLGTLAQAGVWFNSFGALNRTADDISDWGDELVLARLIPNWDNLNEVALGDRSWNPSELVYRSTHSYADREVLLSRQPGTGDIFAVFLSADGVIDLALDEEVVDLRRANELYEAHGEGSADAAGELDVVDLAISLNAAAGHVSQLYVIFVE